MRMRKQLVEREDDDKDDEVDTPGTASQRSMVSPLRARVEKSVVLTDSDSEDSEEQVCIAVVALSAEAHALKRVRTWTTRHRRTYDAGSDRGPSWWARSSLRGVFEWTGSVHISLNASSRPRSAMATRLASCYDVCCPPFPRWCFTTRVTGAAPPLLPHNIRDHLPRIRSLCWAASSSYSRA